MKSIIDNRGIGDDDISTPNSDHTSKTAAEMLRLERDDRTRSERASDSITAFSGSMLFVWLHVVVFAAWIFINLPGSALVFDPFPFSLLTMIVSLEAIFLSTFVLISQNCQAKQADKRAKIDLQVDMISEQEITKLMKLILDIHDRLGIRHTHDAELGDMQKATSIEKLLKTQKQKPVSGRK